MQRWQRFLIPQNSRSILICKIERVWRKSERLSHTLFLFLLLPIHQLFYFTTMKSAFIYFLLSEKHFFISLIPLKSSVNLTMIMIIPLRVNRRSTIGHVPWYSVKGFSQKINVEILSKHSQPATEMLTKNIAGLII